MPEPLPIWIGKDEVEGTPSQPRKDLKPPPHWRLEAVAATERPRSLTIAADGGTVAFIQDRDTSDVWLLELGAGVPHRLTTGRDPMPYWEDTEPRISPDGTQVAYADQGAVWVVAAAGGPPRRLAEAGSPVWLGNDRLIVSVERDDTSRLAVLDVADPWPRRLCDTVSQAQSPAAGDANAWHGDEWGAAVSPDGTAVAFAFTPRDDLLRNEIRIVEVASGAVRALTGTPLLADRSPAWSPDGATIAYRVRALGLVRAAPRRRRRQRRAAAQPRGGRPRRAVVAPGRQPARGDPLPAQPLRPRHRGRDERRAGGRGRGRLLGQSPLDGRTAPSSPPTRTPARRRSSGSCARGAPPRRCTPRRPCAVRSAPHVRPQDVVYTSFDGVEIPGFLFRPAGASSERPAPAIVYPHGGPTSYYGDEWDGHAQYFLDKGYAWLAINFRGSTGYGREFERLNHGDWGVGDTKDCLAAADYLRTLDWVDGEPPRHLRRELRLVPGAAVGHRRPRAPLPLRGRQVRRLRHPHLVGPGRPRRRPGHGADDGAPRPPTRAPTAPARRCTGWPTCRRRS